MCRILVLNMPTSLTRVPVGEIDMVLRVCSIALACVIGLPLGQAAAQSSYGYHPRVVPGPYADEPPPGYYDPRGAVRRLPPSFYEQDGVVYDRRGRRVIFYDAETGLPLARRYGRVTPGPYADDAEPLPRPAFRRPYGGRFVPDDGEGALPERQAALPQY
jgi:hypothetical protein